MSDYSKNPARYEAWPHCYALYHAARYERGRAEANFLISRVKDIAGRINSTAKTLWVWERSHRTLQFVFRREASFALKGATR